MAKHRNGAVMAAAVGMGLLSLQSGAVTAGAKQALYLCADVLIPATFPFMVLSAIGATGIGGAENRALKTAARLLGISGSGLPILFLSLIGGYPVGAATAAQCVAKGDLNPAEGRRLCYCCFNAGPAFVIGAVGTAMLGSPLTGAVLYGCLCLACLVTGRLLGSKSKEEGPCPYAENGTVPLAQILTEGVRQGSENMLRVAAWVILFGALQGLLPEGLCTKAKGLLLCVAEISGGMGAMVKALPLPATAAFLSFGGLCTHCQVMSFSRPTGLRYSRFLLARLVTAGLAAAFAAIAFRLFPAAAAVTVSTVSATPVLSYAGIPTAVSLLFMCVIFVLGLDIGEKV